MRATIEKCNPGEGVKSFFSVAVTFDDADPLYYMPQTAQAAFDWLAENYPGIPTEVNIQ